MISWEDQEKLKNSFLKDIVDPNTVVTPPKIKGSSATTAPTIEFLQSNLITTVEWFNVNNLCVTFKFD